MTEDGGMEIRHGERFWKVSNRYPQRVAEAYGGDRSSGS